MELVPTKLWRALAITLVALPLTWMLIYGASLLQAGVAVILASACILLSAGVAWAHGRRG